MCYIENQEVRFDNPVSGYLVGEIAMPESKGQSPGENQVFITKSDWEKFWWRDRTILLRFACRIVGDSAEAEDVVDKALLSLKPGVLELQEHDNFEDAIRGFLLTVVRRRALDFIGIRDRRRESPLADDGEEMDYRDPRPGPDRKLLAGSFSDHANAAIQEAIDVLPPQLQPLFLFIVTQVKEHELNEIWPMWALARGLDPESKRDRNSNFDQPMRRIRQHLKASGIYDRLWVSLKRSS